LGLVDHVVAHFSLLFWMLPGRSLFSQPNDVMRRLIHLPFLCYTLGRMCFRSILDCFPIGHVLKEILEECSPHTTGPDLFEMVQYWTSINSRLADYHSDLSIYWTALTRLLSSRLRRLPKR